MGEPVEERALEAGLHVRTDDAPSERAAALAEELDADLCTTAHEAEVLLAKVSSLPPLPADALPLLVNLTERLAAAQRIADRTLERAVQEVGERMAASTGVAIHPSAVRDRAAAVVAAREALVAAERELETAEAAAADPVDEAPDPLAAPAPAVSGPSHMLSRVDEPPAPRRRRFFDFFRRRRVDEKEDTRESTSLLQQMAASTDEAFGARRALAARDDQLVLLRATRIRSEEDVRVAERAWHDLAGETPVEELEEVVKRFDPHHEDARTVATETVGVRAVMTLLERAREAWEQGWRTFDLEPPDGVDEVEMAEMAARLSRTIVLVGDAVDKAELLALAAPPAAVVAVEPS